MFILGLAGGFDPIYEARYQYDKDFVHDSAAILLEDGQIVAGIEEERLNRIKHTNKIWSRSADFCLKQRGISISDVDHIAIYASEPYLDYGMGMLALQRPELQAPRSGRELYQQLLEREFGCRVGPNVLKFVNHHRCHAMSAYALSGFEDSLILAIDGAGENISTLVGEVRDRSVRLLASKPVNDSLGFFYLEVIHFLGYDIYEEYKVMGLAPYGDPATFRSQLSRFYTLGPNGDYTIHRERIVELLADMEPRKRGEPFTQTHKDLAASLQEAVEKIGLHILTHYQQQTGHSNLCIAGGVGQNSSMNGQIMSSGLFENVFVPPAAADSGCAIGAAFSVAMDMAGYVVEGLPSEVETVVESAFVPRVQRHAYLGTHIGDETEIGRRLEQWQPIVGVQKLDHVESHVAGLLADGAVIGWVQGRSEFGPRALGNRSILADPRPAENKVRINAMIKKREAYRPFAPSVLKERVRDFFVVPGQQSDFPFMTFVLPVQPQHRENLGAVAHVDGSSRLQTVDRDINPRYWTLISEFEKLTGVPILLNTSFNNNVEPIVNDLDEAVTCFLTSGLDYLVAGDWLVSKKNAELDPNSLLNLIPQLPGATVLQCRQELADYHHRKQEWSIVWNYDERKRHLLSAEMYELLTAATGKQTFGQLLDRRGVTDKRDYLLDELLQLWSLRLVILKPTGVEERFVAEMSNAQQDSVAVESTELAR